MGIFGKKRITIDEFAQGLAVHGDEYILEAVKDIVKCESFPEIPQDRIYGEIVTLHFWSLKIAKIPLEVRNRIIELYMNAQNISEELRPGWHSFIEKRSKEYSDAWGSGEPSNEAMARVARSLLYNIDASQSDNPMREPNEVFLMSIILGLMTANMQTSVSFHDNMKLVP